MQFFEDIGEQQKQTKIEGIDYLKEEKLYQGEQKVQNMVQIFALSN